MVYLIVISCSIYTGNCFEGHRVISVLGLLLSVLPSLKKAYYYYYYYYYSFMQRKMNQYRDRNVTC